MRSVRLPMYWSAIQPQSPLVSGRTSRASTTKCGSPPNRGSGCCRSSGARPPGWRRERCDCRSNAWQRGRWTNFLRAAADRYGPYGSFWNEHPDLDYLPIRTWEIWNEQNIVTFSSRRPGALREAASDLGPGPARRRPGLQGDRRRPLRPAAPDPAQHRAPATSSPASTAPRNVKRYFDGVALHPYVADAGAMRAQIRNLRRVMRVHHDAATPLYMTELGWGSDSFESRWERGLLRPGEGAQPGDVDAHPPIALAGGSPASGGSPGPTLNGSCQFCDSAGLLTAKREAKPAWYLFNDWTGGDPDTVPRASFGD